jgi:hypothetical protein
MRQWCRSDRTSTQMCSHLQGHFCNSFPPWVVGCSLSIMVTLATTRSHREGQDSVTGCSPSVGVGRVEVELLHCDIQQEQDGSHAALDSSNPVPSMRTQQVPAPCPHLIHTKCMQVWRLWYLGGLTCPQPGQKASCTVQISYFSTIKTFQYVLGIETTLYFAKVSTDYVASPVHNNTLT